MNVFTATAVAGALATSWEWRRRSLFPTSSLPVHHRLHHHFHHVHALLHHLHLRSRAGRHVLLRHHPTAHAPHLSVAFVHLSHHGHASLHFFPLLVHQNLLCLR